MNKIRNRNEIIIKDRRENVTRRGEKRKEK